MVNLGFKTVGFPKRSGKEIVDAVRFRPGTARSTLG